nr:hypothetical protein CFP56_60461 [Quercus suber]
MKEQRDSSLFCMCFLLIPNSIFHCSWSEVFPLSFSITSEQSSIQPATIQDFHHPHYSPLLDYTGLNSSITAAQRHWCRVDKSGFTGTSFDEASCQNLQTTSTRGLKDWKPEKLGNIELS